jgi:hypothetical protein
MKLPPDLYATTGDINNFGKYTEAQYKQGQRDALEAAAQHFDSRDKGAGGFYDPHEPAEIIRNMAKEIV